MTDSSALLTSTETAMKKIFGLRKRNYSRNIGQAAKPVVGDMINGQGMGDVSKQRYGLCHMSFNGCEVISVYNALNYIGIPQPLWEIAVYLERYRVLAGFFGCNVYRLGKALEHFGADWERIKTPADTECPAFIVSYWTGRRFLSSIHTVFCHRQSNGIMVYNRYNNCPTVQLCRTLEDIIGKKRPISAYAVKGVKTGGKGERS